MIVVRHSLWACIAIFIILHNNYSELSGNGVAASSKVKPSHRERESLLFPETNYCWDWFYCHFYEGNFLAYRFAFLLVGLFLLLLLLPTPEISAWLKVGLTELSYLIQQSRLFCFFMMLITFLYCGNSSAYLVLSMCMSQRFYTDNVLLAYGYVAITKLLVCNFVVVSVNYQLCVCL